MSFLSSNATIEVPYASGDCFNAIKDAIKTLPKFKLKNESLSAGMLQYSVGMGMTSLTWGDIVTIVITALDGGGTKIDITSTAKAPSLLASVTENKNIQAITNAFMTEIKNYQKVDTAPSSPNGLHAADEIKKYKELLDMGAITQDEFDAKKKQLLEL